MPSRSNGKSQVLLTLRTSGDSQFSDHEHVQARRLHGADLVVDGVKLAEAVTVDASVSNALSAAPERVLPFAGQMAQTPIKFHVAYTLLPHMSVEL
ncbi:hypothetical protein BaRGS_00011833 [Batillaria attramentaria]|uniref:Uncharacterized protein n=1 Tax=Batillaria attramentaria TaxID=370345 RepID=A0ABD0LBS3_9CAEN